MRAEQMVSPTLPTEAARAAVLATSLRAPVLVVQGAIVLGFVIVLGPLAGRAVVLAVALGLMACLVVQRPLMIRRLARALPARGYRPTATLALEWSPDAFTLTTERGENTYRHDEIAWRRDRDGICVLFVAEAKTVVLLPTELVAAVDPGGLARASAR